MTCRLMCRDGEVIEVDQETAKISVLINGLIEDGGVEEDIPIAQVTKPVMEKAIAFMTHIREHPPAEIEKPLSSTDLSQVVDQWHNEYINVDQEMLFELVMAANYLDVKPLLELSCAKVASLIKGKSIQEIRQFFQIENDFSPEEEEQVMQENKWAEESF